ncbi:class I SAM-dependent methyltransferase, partial [Aeromonas enteropelogenes]
INININYSVLELANISDLKEEYSAIISFEAFEYIDSTSLFLPDIVRLLKNDRYFIVSTTNQEKLPFNIERFPYHIKHYTNNE